MMDAIRRDELPSMYFMQYEICSSRRESAQTSSPEFQTEPTDVGCHGSRGEGMMWFVRNLLLVPHFAFPPSAIIKSKVLSPTARRHGWVAFFHPQTRHKAGAFPGKKGTCCNFDLNRIPAEARIPVVITRSSEREFAHLSPGSQSRLTSAATVIIPPEEVRNKFKRIKPLKEISVTQRGWTLDVLNVVRRLVSEGRASRVPNISDQSGTRVTRPSDTFTTADAYVFTRELEKLYPDNSEIQHREQVAMSATLEPFGKRRKEFVPHGGTKAKGRASGRERVQIRQQLQVGFLFARICVCRLTQMPDAKRLRDAGLLIHAERGVWRLP